LTRTQDLQTDLTRTDKDSPNPAIENWAWLGQKLVIPVGQTWPWLPADLTHLRHPLIEPGELPLCAQMRPGILGRKQLRFLQREPSGKPWLWIRRRRSGYEWRFDDVTWTLEHPHMPGWTRRAVLLRNEQPLAAMQPQGRLLSTWTEIVYDRRGYRLAQNKDHPSSYLLVNRSGEELVAIERGPLLSIRLSRALPLPLLVMVTLQVVSEASTAMQSTESVEASL
jgi:hypothetical protein